MSDATDQDRMTEITIAPDGRVFVFGLSQPVLQILRELNPADRRVRQLCTAMSSETTSPNGMIKE